jgi:hypothetical protein
MTHLNIVNAITGTHAVIIAIDMPADSTIIDVKLIIVHAKIILFIKLSM